MVELITLLLDGALDDVEHAVLAHLATCDGCARYLDQFRRTIRELGGLPAEGIPGEAKENLLQAFRDQLAWDERGDPDDDLP
ncbi:hypothetical protein GCM10010411_12660 [Actinomadura fulvescens]|uniref:Putative zinc-finger domain-containing protein n=1 Tax=Actinomadura fulvescens TaxID=46160 RepID=A0ABN3PEA7_9ACTN